MDMRGNFARLASIAASAMMVSATPIPAAYAKPPNCAVKAYLLCKNDQWQGYGYSSEDECIEWETEFCIQQLPPPPIARCSYTTGGGINGTFWYVCD